MTDMTEWIKERRRIHNVATGGVWVHDEYTGVEGIVYPDTAFAEAVADCGDRDDSAAIVDAHNALPALLTAVEKVLELHQAVYLGTLRIKGEPDDIRYGCVVCNSHYPCQSVRAIEGAINE